VAITGVHALVYTAEPDAVRAIFRDVFGWEHVDLGDNWLIFKLPPAELAAHPSELEIRHEITLMCDDLEATMAELQAKGIEFEGEPLDEGWGITITMVLPGDTKLLLYEPRHESPI
jgi:catechol 2,3-dioxygenase-like lactoylglutathione lyase family enzyme